MNQHKIEALLKAIALASERPWTHDGVFDTDGTAQVEWTDNDCELIVRADFAHHRDALLLEELLSFGTLDQLADLLSDELARIRAFEAAIDK